MTLLEAKKVTKHFGGLKALQDVVLLSSRALLQPNDRQPNALS